MVVGSASSAVLSTPTDTGRLSLSEAATVSCGGDGARGEVGRWLKSCSQPAHRYVVAPLTRPPPPLTAAAKSLGSGGFAVLFLSLSSRNEMKVAMRW